MDGVAKITVGVKVTPDYLEELDTMVQFFQSRIEVGKVTRAELLLKALDMYKAHVATMPEYQGFLTQKG
ncbi:hypothetical protein [Brevibacillus sp. H7]|uniref:hypothetical protein n=1 Tax=Brevibacillus sp. H7 TaxID=3349138 RepID=UPI003812B93A